MSRPGETDYSKGSFPRTWNTDTFRDNFDQINWDRSVVCSVCGYNDSRTMTKGCTCTALHYSEACPTVHHANVAKQARRRAEQFPEQENTKTIN